MEQLLTYLLIVFPLNIVVTIFYWLIFKICVNGCFSSKAIECIIINYQKISINYSINKPILEATVGIALVTKIMTRVL